MLGLTIINICLFTISAYFWIQTPSSEIVTENGENQFEIPTIEKIEENPTTEKIDNIEGKELLLKILNTETKVLRKEKNSLQEKVYELENNVYEMEYQISKLSTENEYLLEVNSELGQKLLNREILDDSHNDQYLEMQKKIEKSLLEKKELIEENKELLEENGELQNKIDVAVDAFEQINSLIQINIKIHEANNNYFLGRTNNREKKLEIIQDYIIPLKKKANLKKLNIDLGPETLDGTDYISETVIIVSQETIKFLSN